MKQRTSMTLNRLELTVNLGWQQDERIKQQIVTIEVALLFDTPPVACKTDQLTDTDCYDALIKTLKDEIVPRHFRLLEHLAHTIYHLVKQQVTSAKGVQISVTKKPDIKNLMGGVTFYYGDAG